MCAERADLKIISDFSYDKQVDSRYTSIGENVSPPLRLEDLDDEAETLAIILTDDDAEVERSTHWLIWNIPAVIDNIQENIPVNVKKVPELDGAYQGKNDFGDIGYTGPALPSSTFEKPHTYRLIVYALDQALELEPGATEKELLETMKDHIIQKGFMSGTYQP
ncbi:MAG: YbhB/YbcL family Raf kinase inhibitor-like protein [Halanaerobiales bacterium]|nr:YbhB/YbcL family Raf kinase inhibitor-like protein [Halanaerobiales bacterium]